MTTPDVPLRFELDVRGARHARAGVGRHRHRQRHQLLVHADRPRGARGRRRRLPHGRDESSEGTVTGWDPPRRFAYEEPDWAALAGHDGAPRHAAVTEFLVEAQSGGTCVVRVVSSAFGTGADWEQEFFDEMEKGWAPFFDHLRLYLTHFPGQRVTPLEVDADVPGTPAGAVVGHPRGASASSEVGQPVDVRGLSGHGRARRRRARCCVRLTDPVPGSSAFVAFGTGDGRRPCAVVAGLPVLRRRAGATSSGSARLAGVARAASGRRVGVAMSHGGRYVGIDERTSPRPSERR